MDIEIEGFSSKIHIKNVWNIKKLDPPPTATYKISKPTDITQLKQSFALAIGYFKDQDELHMEAALLSRIMLHMKQKFRADKGFKLVQKINRAFQGYLEMNIISTLDNFTSLLPTTTDFSYLPTGNMLDYVLVRLQGLASLMCKIIESAKICAEAMEQRIAIGQFWKIAYLVYASCARIWVLCQKIVSFVCTFYNVLLPYRKVLQNSNWLTEDYIFPSDLKTWLKSERQYETAEDTNSENDKTKQKESNNPFKMKSSFESMQQDEEMGEVITESADFIKRKSAFEMMCEDEDIAISEKDNKLKKTNDYNKSKIVNLNKKSYKVSKKCDKKFIERQLKKKRKLNERRKRRAKERQNRTH